MVTLEGMGPPPLLLDSLDQHFPARDLVRQRHKYFIGVLDPCASIEFTRGCPWDCTFCSAWTFYGRSYRQSTPEAVIEDLARIREPNVFIVDDVAFIHPEHGMAIGREIEKRGIRKQYYLETRCDVLLRNREVFAYWKRLGLLYMFLGIEALDEETLHLHRKRITLNENLQALEVARQLGLIVAINLIADPDWDEAQFRFIQEWAASVPEIVHLTVNTPYPGTETWHTEARKLTSLDYRLFDVQHAVLPTRLPSSSFMRTGQDAGHLEPQTPGLPRSVGSEQDGPQPSVAWSDQFSPHALEVSSCVQPGATVRRPLSGWAIYLEPTARADRHHAQTQ